jgi:hypothetical protein
MRLLCNSIPKSGTYLLAAIANYCGYRDGLLRFVEGGTNVVDESNNLLRFEVNPRPDRLGRLPDGSYAPCHLAHSRDLCSFIKSNDIKHLFIYRHPADVVDSYVRFVTYSNNFRVQSDDNRRFQDQLRNNFDCDEDRFVYVFRHLRSAFNFDSGAAWLDCQACLPVKFEKLYEELLLLEHGKTGQLITGIFKYLESDASLDPYSIFSAVYGTGPTFMQEKNKIDQFKRHDLTKISEAINDSAFAAVLDLYNYEI